MGLIETALKKVLITQHPEDRRVLYAYESLDDLLQYVDEHSSTSEVEAIQLFVAEYLHYSSHNISSEEIETGSYNEEIPLPLLEDLEDP